MKDIEVSVAKGKKEFTKIIRDSSQSEGNVIITKRGKPAAVIMSFENYQKMNRMARFAELIELKKRFSKSGVSAKDVYEESKRMLERGQ